MRRMKDKEMENVEEKERVNLGRGWGWARERQELKTSHTEVARRKLRLFREIDYSLLHSMYSPRPR